MIKFTKIFLLNELSRLKKENEKLFNENIELRNELKNSRNSRFKLASKLEDLNNYITFLEVKIPESNEGGIVEGGHQEVVTTS